MTLLAVAVLYVAILGNGHNLLAWNLPGKERTTPRTPFVGVGGTNIAVRPTNTATAAMPAVAPTSTSTPTPFVVPTPTALPTIVAKNDVGLIVLQVEPWSSDTWSVVQWEDAFGNWHNVEGWQGHLDGGIQVWEVLPSEFGKGPFRWVVYEQRGGGELARSGPFYLPKSGGDIVRISVSQPATATSPPPNHPPVIQSLDAQLPEVETGQPVGVQCVAFDPDGDTLTYHWDVSAGTIVGAGPNVTYNAPILPGAYTILVSVTDGRGARVERDMPIKVRSAGPLPDAAEPTGKFGKIWHEEPSIAQRVGLALGGERSPVMAMQVFQEGTMLFVEDAKRIFLLRTDNRWWSFPDSWSPSQPEEDPSLVPPLGLYQPRFGFGKVWREKLLGTPLHPGWATEPEHGYTGAAMDFERGFMLWSDEAIVYVLFGDGTWTRIVDVP